MSLPQLIHDVRAAVEKDRLIDLSEVESLTSVRKSTIYALMAQDPPAFPRCVKVTSRRVAWSERAVLGWVQARLAPPFSPAGGGQ